MIASLADVAERMESEMRGEIGGGGEENVA